MRDKEREIWRKKRQYSAEDMLLAEKILIEIKMAARRARLTRESAAGWSRILAKHALVAAYRNKIASEEWEEDPVLLAKIRMKPVRTLSGVTTITVLTKPHPCPGHCIFCPTEEGLPQSYLLMSLGGRAEGGWSTLLTLIPR